MLKVQVEKSQTTRRKVMTTRKKHIAFKTPTSFFT